MIDRMPIAIARLSAGIETVLEIKSIVAAIAKRMVIVTGIEFSSFHEGGARGVVAYEGALILFLLQ
jgi:hypothetical protein